MSRPSCRDPSPRAAISWRNSGITRRRAATKCCRVLSVDASAFHPAKNGFVACAIRAYSAHHNLVIRPGDVWLAIAVQFGSFVNGNAEALQSIFIDHKGKKELVVSQAAALHSADYGLLARELKKNVKDEKVCDWISTTTKNVVVVGSVVLMTTFKSYFEYTFRLMCGIPFVTLLGTTEDWEEIDRRVDELDKYGEICKKWRVMLKKITAQFVESSKGNVDRDFWNRICHRIGGDQAPRATPLAGSQSFASSTGETGHFDYRNRSDDTGVQLLGEYPCVLSSSIQWETL